MRQDLYEKIEEKVADLFFKGHEAMDDGLTLAEVWMLIQSTLEALAQIVRELPATAEERRELALDLIDRFYAEEIAPIDLPWVPDAVEGFVDKTIGDAVRPMGEWLFDRIEARAA